MGRSQSPEDDKLAKKLSFMDFDDEKRGLIKKSKDEQNLAFDSDGDETSDW